MKKVTLIILCVTSGILIPCVGPINLQMKAIVGDSAYWAVSWAYCSGMVLTVSYALLTGRSPSYRVCLKGLGAFLKERICLNFMVLSAGLLGVYQNMVSTTGTSLLGSGLLTLGILIGQILMGLTMDMTGIGWAEKVGRSRLGILGGIVVIAGCGLYQITDFLSKDEGEATPISGGADGIYIWNDQSGDSLVDFLNTNRAQFARALAGTAGETSSFLKIVFFLLAVTVGASSCIQGSVGGKLGTLTGRIRRSTAWTSVSGSLVILIIAVATTPRPQFLKPEVSDWWKFIVAPLNIYQLVVATICPMYLSFATVFAYVIIGQLIGATLIDGAGLLGVPKKTITWSKYLGIFVVLTGVALVAFGRHRLNAKFIHQVLSSTSTSIEV